MAGLEHSLTETKDATLLKQATEALGRDSEDFAARRMDATISKALAGVAIDDLETVTGEND